MIKTLKGRLFLFISLTFVSLSFLEWFLFSQKIVSFILVFGFALLAIIFAYFFIRVMIRPLERLIRVAEKMSTGNLEVQAETKTYAEVNRLATAFNQMAKKVKLSLEDIKLLGSFLEDAQKKLKEYLDEIKRVNKELDAFTYSVSHDLRAPLVALDGFSTIMLNEFSKLPVEKIGYYLQRINFNAKKMAKLIDDILELSRVGRVVGEKEEIDLTKLMEEISEEFRNRLEEKKIRFDYENLPKVYGDLTQVYRIFANLVSNATKFSDPKKEKKFIKVGCNGTDKENFYEFYVQDNGIGILQEYQGKVFDIFQRVGDTEAEGTGIGLTLVRKIIEHHGGKIWLESVKGEGTTFYFTLPKLT